MHKRTVHILRLLHCW